MNDLEDPKLDIDDSLKEDQLLEVEEVEEDMEGDDDERKLNSSNTSLDKYVGKGRNSKYMTLLPEDFEPGDMDVLCGRGKRCFNSPGNQRFRKLVAARADDYSAASTRTDKTFIVCSIVSEVRKASPKGGFVKKDSTTGRWYEVGDFNAHEKTSQMFRDVLHENYLSSNKSKKKRRDLFRTNSKKRMLQQQATINASAGRFLRGNGVARHHSYGSVKRAVGAQSYSLMKMRQQSHSARSDSWRNSSHSAHSGHESWQNSWHSGDGIKSEPGLLFGNNPRLALAGRRQNSFGDLNGNGSMGDLNNSFGEVQAQDQFHNSFGEFNTGGGDFKLPLGAPASFHNSCVEFPSSFADGNNVNNNMLPQQFHNSFAGFDGTNNDFNVNSSDLHNSFGEFPYNNFRDPVVPMRARSNSNPGYRDMNNFSPNPEREQQYTLEAESVPLSISVPGEEEMRGRTDSDFQLEFETDENSGNQARTRGPVNFNNNNNNNNFSNNGHYRNENMNINMNMNRNMNTNNNANNPGIDMNGLSIVDTLETVGYSTTNADDNPFEPVPLPDMEPERIF